jgi:predicted AlkP superfamily pyrophosphatase or phosphodiesterase
MNPIGAIVLISFSICTSVGAAQTTTERRAIRSVVIVSVDGLMPASYVAPDAHGLKVPTLREMARAGAWSEGVRSVFPSTTLPGHTSIATGTNPGTHGIVSNSALDPLDNRDRRLPWYAEDIRVPTLWDAARARGLRTALVGWPVTVGALGTVVIPKIWASASHDELKLARALATPGVVDAVASRFPNFRAGFAPPNIKDESLTDIAVHLIETLRPHLLMLSLPQLDLEQHREGPFTPKILATIEDADREIARVMAALKKAGSWNETALLVLSDHGFARIAQQVSPNVLLTKERLIALDRTRRVTDWKASVVTSVAHAYVYLRDRSDTQTGKRLLDIFSPLPSKAASGIGRVYTQEEIRSRGGDLAAYLALEAAPGFGFSGEYHGDYISRSRGAGAHGYDPERPDMRASLLVTGPAIVPGMMRDRGRLIDIAPTVGRWLGLKMEKAEGGPLPIALHASPQR